MKTIQLNKSVLATCLGVYAVLGVLLAGQARGATIRYQASGDYTNVYAVTGTSGWQSGGTGPGGLPGAGDTIRFNWGGNTVTLTNFASTVTTFQMGVDESGTLVVNNSGQLTATGGSTVGNNSSSASGVIGRLTVNAGGQVTVSNVLFVGNSPTLNVTGILTVNGGTVNVTSHLWAGSGASTTGYIYLTNGGTLNIGGNIGLGTINASTPSGSTAFLYVQNGGVLNLHQITPTTSIQPGSVLDISGTGKVVITGNYYSAITNYVSAGKITANGGSSVYCFYDTAANTTTVSANKLFPAKVTWNPAGNPGSAGMWNEDASWTGATPPSAPGTNTITIFNVVGAAGCTVTNAAVAGYIDMGDSGPGGTLIVTNGGSLTAGSGNWSAIGYSSNAVMVVTTNGSASFGNHLWIGFNPGASGTLTLNGGTVSVVGMFGLGWGGGTGIAQVNSGTLNLAQWNSSQSISGASVLNLTGTGKVVITGNYYSSVTNYVSAGRITANGGNNVACVYNATANTTTVGIAPAIVGGINFSAANLCAGSQLVLTLTNVAGTSPLFYQWRTNGMAILNATNASYTNSAVSAGWNYTCVVTNVFGAVTSAVVTVTVNANPSITTAAGALAAGTYNAAYNQTISATGATGFTATGLPGGLSLNGTSGVISGMPTGVGTFSSVTVTATNASGCSDVKTYSITINPASSTIGYAATGPFTYSGASKSPTVNISGSSGTQTTSYVGTSVAYNSLNAPTNAGTYYVSNTVAADAYYFGATNSLTFTINPKAASVTADAKTKAYGAANPTLTATVGGTVNGDVLNYTLATDATQFSGVGVSNITVSLGSNPNYTVVAANSTLAITPASASVTADAKTKAYGAANPTLTATVGGTVNGDALNYTLATDATQFSGVGVSNITVSLGSNPNYTVVAANSTLAITPASASVTADAKTKAYGAANPTLTATVGGTVNGDTLNYTLATDATQFSGVGVSNITVSLGSNPNYTVLAANSTLTITQAVPTLVLTSSAQINGYKDSVSFTATLPADSTGSVVFSSTNGPISTNSLSGGAATSLSVTNLPRGTNIITVAYPGDGNYLGSSSTLEQVVTNHPPVAMSLTMGAQSGTPAVLLIVGGKHSPTDVDGDPLVVSAVQSPSTQGGTVTTDGSSITYTAPGTLTGDDTYTYTVTDGFGGSSVALVTVHVAANGPGFNLLSGPVNNGDGTATLTYMGIPGYAYALDNAPNLALPIAWTPLLTNTVGNNGKVSFTIDLSAGEGYFRTRGVDQNP